MFSSVLASTLLIAGAVATNHAGYPSGVQHDASVSTPTPEAAGGQTVHVVQVGSPTNATALTFSPENTIAKVGDMIQFQFYAKNHSVVQTAFGSPCVPMQQVQQNATNAFFSGFMPFAEAPEGELLTYSVPVTSTAAMWFYCSQGKHCQAGMVGAINSPESANRSVAEFKKLAATTPENLSPGQIPSDVSGTPASGTPGSPAAPGAGSPTNVGDAGLDASSTPAPFTGGASSLQAATSGFAGLVIAALAFFAL